MVLSELKPAEYYPRVISSDVFEGLKNSIENFGDISGIVFNKTTGNLVAGHQRVKALSAMYGNLPIVEHTDTTGVIHTESDAYPVRFVEWDEITERAANLSANNPNIQGNFVPEQLNLIIEEINLSGKFDLGELNIEDLKVEIPNILSDLAENGFADHINNEAKTFTISLNFDKGDEEVFKDWLSVNGKSRLKEEVRKLVLGESYA